MADGSFADLHAELKSRAGDKPLPLPSNGEPLYRTMSVRAVRKDKREVDFVCSTEKLDSYGTVLEQDWNLERYNANPVVLYNHNIGMQNLPIGQARNVRVEGEGASRQLVATVWFSDKTQLAREAWDLVDEGTLRGISVGFDWTSLRFEFRDDMEIIVLFGLILIELSITPTPANPECVARLLRARAAAPLTRAGVAPVSAPITTPKAAERSTQAPSARKDNPMALSEDEIKALQTRAAELTTKNLDAEARATTSEARATKAETELSAAQIRAKTFETQNAALVIERDTALTRATKAEGEIIELEVGALVGKRISPAEKDQFVKLRTLDKPLFDAMVAQRSPMAHLDPVIPPAANGAPPPAAVDPKDLSDSRAADAFFQSP